MPHPFEIKPKPPKRKPIKLSDVEQWCKELEKAGVKHRQGDITITEYDDDHYQLGGSVRGIVSKEKWNRAMMKASGYSEEFINESFKSK